MCLLPLIHIFAVSVSSNAASTGNLVKFWPIGFNLDAYRRTLDSPDFAQALWISVSRTALGTALSMFLCFLAAYPMSKVNSQFRGRTAYSWYFIITILFNGGLIPTYLVVNATGIRDTIWALVMPGVVVVFNVVLMMNFFRGIPKELEEAAQIDGANHWRVLFTVFLPVSLPSIATLSLFTVVSHWNSWFDGLIYMSNDKQPLATMIQILVQKQDYTRIEMNVSEIAKISARTLRATQIFIGMLPVLVVYPFLQKYFVKGMTLGSVKE